ncbi:uncharacterized protein [Rutidosis leptorrhynchoides]|uniref:uncharacterized protein n=1 Tax=Rutidosis leptorrhynchoides TaxID=125765 RepID=UPI003A9A1F9D
MHRENAQNFLADAFRSIAPKSMQHKFEQPNFLRDMIAKFCAENTDTRTKKATEITTAADKFVQHISDYSIVTPPIMPATLGVYSGLTDPMNFLQRFEGVVSTYNWDDPVACRVFPMVLQGQAREWFHSLQARSIIDFIDLRDKFLLQFQNLLPQKKTHIEYQKISGFLHAINPQRHPTLVRRLRRDVPPNFAKVQQETYDYLRGGEDSTITPACGCGYPRRNGGGGYPRNDRHQDQNDNHGYNRRDRYSSRKWNESFNIIQMLTKTPKEILLQERVAKSFPDPQPLAENNRRDKSKFCVFHDDYGHDTNRCRDLAELIAEAYEQCKLDHLIVQSATSTANAILLPAEATASQVPNAADRKAPAVKNLGVKMVSKKENLCRIQFINVVEVQGEMSVFQISEQITTWQCPSITFPPANLSADLDKPVVVSCHIANTGIVIMKVHVDTGSSVDVMYEQCFRKLPANIKALMKPNVASLAGFSGESTWPISKLELQVELVDDRDESLRRQALSNLYVMRNQSRFNMILGHTALRMFSVIPSTLHEMVKFSANKGIGTLTSAVVEPFCAMIVMRESVGVEGHAVPLNNARFCNWQVSIECLIMLDHDQYVIFIFKVVIAEK